MSLVVPESAIVGVPASVQASTWGSSCTQPDRTVTQVIGLLADITLYDRDPPAGTPCARILKGIARNVTVTFSLPGEATVRLHGRSFTDTTTIGASLTVR
jgi:hypothetical protein